MNKTRIEWTDFSLNPVVGCFTGCDFCYARRQAKRQKQRCRLCYEFTPHAHLERIEKLNPRQKPKKIFMDSMWDWCGQGVKDEWIVQTLKKMSQCSQHTFQILSKFPKRYSRFNYPTNVWLGTSIATNRDLHRIDDLLHTDSNHIKFVSVEPIHERIDHDFSGLDWIIVGAETGNRPCKITPEKEWISEIIERARISSIPVFVKDNLGWRERVREFPLSSTWKRIDEGIRDPWLGAGMTVGQ